MLRVGVLGLGVGRRHIDAYLAHQSCEVTWICDFDGQLLDDVARNICNVKKTTDAKRVLEASDIDIVSIATYDEYHFEQIEAALLAGKHVFVEKPICLTLGQLETLKALLKKTKALVLSANFVLRSCPLFIGLKKEIKNHVLGEIISVEADYIWGRKHKLESGWRTQTPGYSIVLGAGIHMVDLVMWLLDMRPSTVQGMGNLVGMERAERSFNTYCIATLKFDNGTIAKITGNGTSVHPHFHKLEVYGHVGSFLHNINGTASIFKKNNARPEIAYVNSEEKYPARKERPLIIHSFVDTILNEHQEALVSAGQVFDAMSVGLAIDKAVETGETVEVVYG
jgi:predicted dehydrogenase